MALPFWYSLSLMALPSEAPALPSQEKTYLPQESGFGFSQRNAPLFVDIVVQERYRDKVP